MPRIRCNYEGCIHLEGNLCTAGEIELDQELGCLTFSQVEEEAIIGVEEEELEEIEKDEAWEEEENEEEDLEDWEEDEDEDEDWEDDDDDDEEDGWSSAKSRRR